MYESPEYWELKKTITHWETVRRYVDLARVLRAMSYDTELTLSTTNSSPYDGRKGSAITLKDSLKGDLLRFAAERCEEIAVKIAAGEPKVFDVREACKV